MGRTVLLTSTDNERVEVTLDDMLGRAEVDELVEELDRRGFGNIAVHLEDYELIAEAESRGMAVFDGEQVLNNEDLESLMKLLQKSNTSWYSQHELYEKLRLLRWHS